MSRTSMKHEKSCGIIPFTIKNNKTYVILIKQNNGVIGFPKGHVEQGESEKETALRECFEETNLQASIVSDFREEITYYMEEYDAYKTVVFFIGLIDKTNIKRQESEISDIRIVEVKEALELISYEQSKEVYMKALKFLNLI